MALGGGFALLQLIALGWAAGDSVPTPIRVTLDAAPECSTPEAFYQSVRARTDRVRLANAGEPSIDLGVKLVRTGSKVHGELRMTGEHGESDTRRVDGATCAEVVEALSLTVALALVPTARVEPGETSSTAESPSGSAAAQPPRPDAAPTRDSDPNSEPDSDADSDSDSVSHGRMLEVALGAHAMVGGFVSSDVQMGGELALRFTLMPETPSPISFSIGALHLRNDLFAAADRAQFRFSAVALGVCPAHFGLLTRGTLEACLLGIGGSLVGRGVGFTRNQSSARSYWGLGGTLVARLPVGPEPGFGVEGTLGVSVPLVERKFVASSPDRPLGETRVIAALASLGVFWAF